MIISHPGGSGSQWLVRCFRDTGLWIGRPDEYQIWGRSEFDKGSATVKTPWGVIGNNEQETVREIEKKEKENLENGDNGFNIKFSSWGGRGLLTIPAIWIIRDPVQTYVSVSKMERHGNQLTWKNRGTINNIDVIRRWLYGPIQYWKGQFENALNDEDGFIIRYGYFLEDFEKVIQDERYRKYEKLYQRMTEDFFFKYNEPSEFIEPESEEFIKNECKDYYKWIRRGTINTTNLTEEGG